MGDAKHTPGPWHVRREDTTLVIESAYGADDICGIHNAYEGEEELSLARNARLIAAAPTMYEFIARKALEGDADAAAIIAAANGSALPAPEGHRHRGRPLTPTPTTP